MCWSVTCCCCGRALQVVVIDERFELMLIFWSTMAVFQANFGGALKKSLTDQIDQIKKCVRVRVADSLSVVVLTGCGGLCVAQ
jgi:hypothetical protein